MLTKAWHPLFYHRVQWELWTDLKTRFPIVAAGRGSGKTDISLRKLVLNLPLKKPWTDPRYFYGAPTRDQAKRIAWDRIKALIPEDWVRGEPSETELKIDTVFGSYIQVVGMDKPHRIEGAQWDGGVIDEYSDIKPGSFKKSVYPALSWRRGFCSLQGVPKRQGIGASEFRSSFKKAQAGEMPGAKAFEWTAEEILPPDVIAEAKQTLDLKTYQEQFLAMWLNAAGLIFHAFDPEENVLPCSYHDKLPIVVGSDFNVDPMCWVLCHQYGNQLECFGELFLRDCNTRQALDRLHYRFGDHAGGWEFYGDAAGRARHTSADRSDYQIISDDKRFAKKSVHYPRANPSRVDRFASCNSLLCTAEGHRGLRIDPTCKHLIADLEDRAFKPGTREPDDSEDIGHITDALGYIVHMKFPVGFDSTVPGTQRFQHIRG